MSADTKLHRLVCGVRLLHCELTALLQVRVNQPLGEAVQCSASTERQVYVIVGVPIECASVS